MLMKSVIEKIALVLFAVCALAVVARGQAASPTPTPSPGPAPPPSTDIYLVELTGAGGDLKTSAPRRVTDWEGYDNQPSFTPDGRAMLYTSIRADAQADIYRYDLAARTAARLTDTPESEYSPTVTPDGKFFSVIRVERDGTQRLWKFPLAGGAPVLVLEKTKPVGYHVWTDKDTLMLFVLGEPVTMQLVDTGTELTGVVATNIGRGLQRVPRQEKISFVHKVSTDEWLVKEFDLKTHRKTTLTKTLAGSEDYAWMPDGALLLMAQGSKLFAWKPGSAEGWKEFADLSSAGLKNITRLAITPRGDLLAIVAQREAGR